jgi:hypothetical protein
VRVPGSRLAGVVVVGVAIVISVNAGREVAV